MRVVTCPLCGNSLTNDVVTFEKPFACPSCGELLQTAMFATSKPAAVLAVGVITIGLLTRVCAWYVALFLVLIFPLVRYALHVLLGRLVGPVIEPYSADPHTTVRLHGD
jgi:hypothetical protein